MNISLDHNQHLNLYLKCIFAPYSSSLPERCNSERTYSVVNIGLKSFYLFGFIFATQPNFGQDCHNLVNQVSSFVHSFILTQKTF